MKKILYFTLLASAGTQWAADPVPSIQDLRDAAERSFFTIIQQEYPDISYTLNDSDDTLTVRLNNTEELGFKDDAGRIILEL